MVFFVVKLLEFSMKSITMTFKRHLRGA